MGHIDVSNFVKSAVAIQAFLHYSLNKQYLNFFISEFNSVEIIRNSNLLNIIALSLFIDPMVLRRNEPVPCVDASITQEGKSRQNLRLQMGTLFVLPSHFYIKVLHFHVAYSA